MSHDPRIRLIDHAKNGTIWDVIVIGGGATGLATAWDAVSRGLKVALLEKSDFAACTSSRSTKLIHGGIRYLKNGEISLVKESLHERSLLLKNAPEFTRTLRFIIPTDNLAARYYYRLGMWAYDALAKDSNVKPSEILTRSELLSEIPQYKNKNICGGIAYSDAQFDDSALAVAFAQGINNSGNLAINYVSVDQIKLNHEKISSIRATDGETGQIWQMKSKIIVNATGIFSDSFRNSNNISSSWSIRTSRGTHIVVSSDSIRSESALIVPKTNDGRVIFAIPWKNHTLIGTTDVVTMKPQTNPIPSEEEIDYLLKEISPAFHLNKEDITSSWAGIRPLVARRSKNVTSKLSRKHIIDISPDGLISILGGKWTTCRKMAEDTIDIALKLKGMNYVCSNTKDLKLTDHGADKPLLKIKESPTKQINENDINTCFFSMYARSVDDILLRRTRMGMLNTKVANDQKKEIHRVLENLKRYGK